ncbi:MAG TPA: TonB-dependent receptor [Steroidobacteraceae bacterium]|nr:TonB-dependent receptor [Steroidobacteraceae bacterium]
MRSKTLTGSVAVALGLAAPALGFAAAPGDESIIEQIIVTAQKRAVALQDVPFSVAAPTGDQIRNAGASSLPELGRMVPGLAIADLGPGQSQVALRGISAGQVVRDQPGVKAQVGVYLDESPISVALFTPDLDLFDLDRFEVLRGPQGTLFGSGSISGVLRYITAQPELNQFGGTVEVQALQPTDGDFGGSLKGMLNVPVGDTTAMRLVGYHNELPGFIDSVYPGRPKREDVNSGTKSGARLAWLIQPTENFSVTPRIVYQKLETDGYPRIDVWNILGNPFTTTQPPVNPGKRGQVTQIPEGLTDEFRLGDLKIEANVGPVTLTSITSRTNRDVLVLRDASQLTGSVTVDVGGTPAQARFNSPLYDRTQLEATSQEFRVASNGNDTFQWLVGTFFEDVDRKYGQTLPTPGYDAFSITSAFESDSSLTGAPPDTPFYSRLQYNLQQFALFGEGTWHFADQWAATLGARYYDYDEDRVLTFGGVFSAALGNLAGVTRVPGQVSSDGFSPRAILSYEVNDDVTINAQLARGFRLGGINDPLNVPLCGADLPLFNSIFSTNFKDESAWNYEIGAKTELAGGRVTFNSAVFYSDIDDLQANVDSGNCSSRIVVNVPKAHTLGVEAELFARPSPNWDFGIGATWVEAEVDSNVTGIGTTPLAGMRKGNRMPTSPELQATASISYQQPVFSTLEGFGVFSVQYVGSSFSQLADQEAGFGCVGCAGSPRLITIGNPTITSIRYDNEMPSYSIGNLRVGVRSDVWEAALFINNLWDERAFLALDRERGTSARVGYLTNQPRTFGVSLRMNF